MLECSKIKELWGDDYGAVKLPTYTCAGQQIQMSSFKGYKYMAVNAYTEYPEWANKLAQWFTNEDNQKLRFEMKNAGPANKAAAADDAVKRFLLLWLLWIRHSTESSKELEILTGMLRQSLAKNGGR